MDQDVSTDPNSDVKISGCGFYGVFIPVICLVIFLWPVDNDHRSTIFLGILAGAGFAHGQIRGEFYNLGFWLTYLGVVTLLTLVLLMTMEPFEIRRTSMLFAFSGIVAFVADYGIIKWIYQDQVR
ncbi:MAG: hypothetical protein COW16_03690 [Sphingomonadales bacterium CG12_big_fil_rev_8_21_14_0_65_65_10]|nr:MAG: hypothetical protein COW16_03690 [Sphingomonadales bacterium CG12_big_fil_rev_8_21_14_0_65_65_10]